MAIKKIANVFVNQLKVTNYAGCQIQFIVKHLAHFLPFLKAPSFKADVRGGIIFLLGFLKMVKNALVVRHLTSFKV